LHVGYPTLAHPAIGTLQRRIASLARLLVIIGSLPHYPLQSMCLDLRHRLCLLMLSLPGTVAAVEVYKCTNVQGDIAFQDVPCSASDEQLRLRLADPPPPPLAETAPEPAAGEPLQEPPPMQTRPPLAPLWFCTRFDGTRYASDTGVPQRQAVPLGVIGGGMGLNRARNSAPGGKIPILPPGASADAAFVWTEDQCLRASAAASCAYWDKELDSNRTQLKRAFKSEAEPFQARERELRERLAGC
jgi:Domain of unknown function (DUF4124)